LTKQRQPKHRKKQGYRISNHELRAEICHHKKKERISIIGPPNPKKKMEVREMGKREKKTNPGAETKFHA